MKYGKWSMIGALAVGALLGITMGFFGEKGSSTVAQQGLWIELSADQKTTDRVAIPSFAPLVKRAEPAVLFITTEAVVKQESPRLPPGLENSPFKDFFFGPQVPQEYKTRGQGSGFLIHPSGYALTNNHVVEGATKISVKVGTDLKVYDAEVIDSDAKTDVALIKIKADRKDWPSLPLGSSEALQVGDWTVAIGNPLGLVGSVTAGIVSAKGRDDIHPSGKDIITNFIQISTPINPGNSGGPLLNVFGEVVAINAAVSMQGQGIGFAIPIDQIKAILPQLKAGKGISRSWLGVQIVDVSPELAKASGLSSPYGAAVREVLAGSPAEKAGIEAGDIITEFDGQLVKSKNALRVMASAGAVGKTVKIIVYRRGKPKNISLVLEKVPEEPKPQNKTIEKKGTAIKIEGLGCSVVDSADKDLEGAVITEVVPGGLANAAEFQVNDIIVELTYKVIKSASELEKAVKNTPSGDLLRIYVKRGKSKIFVAIPKP